MSGGGLLLHVCCAPCAAYPVPALREVVPRLAGFFYNPNIAPAAEHDLRRDALERYAPTLGLELIIAGGVAAGGARSPADAPDPGPCATGEAPVDDRCRRCYEVRLRATAREARRLGFGSFSTTLLYSIRQKHELVRTVGEEVARAEGVAFLYRDLRAGWEEGGRRYRESGLYRQRWCGCATSARERDERRAAAKAPAGFAPGRP
ncbi:MAG TPA: epoxyqueuosine reductase QueH [Candidatus Methanoperedens sp.]|nr:epoxyqueuosine reductase QueH [Candidatus Methanoperedens sp.]